MVGRLKHSLKEKCPECGKTLQLRVIENKGMQKGVEVVDLEEYVCCSNKNCEYEREVKQKRRRRVEEL